MVYDVVIVGGGPGGLSAALALGRGRKRVLLCDSGPRRNAAAVHIQNFVTRDGTPPDEFRRIGREQLGTYPNVDVRDVRVEAISGGRGAFRVELSSGPVEARRILLCTGMIDEVLPIEGFRELWGRSIFQCPYCHGWEVQDRRWAYLARGADASHLLPFAMQLRGWSRDVTVVLADSFEIPRETAERLKGAGVRVETSPVRRLVARDGHLASAVLEDGTDVPMEILFAHPPQRQVDVVKSLGLALDEAGFVQIDPMKRETSVPGIYAAGDLTTRMQGAVMASAAAVQTAAALNMELTMELVSAV